MLKRDRNGLDAVQFTSFATPKAFGADASEIAVRFFALPESQTIQSSSTATEAAWLWSTPEPKIKVAQPISVSRIRLQLCPENHAALGEVVSLSWRTRFCLGIKLMLGGTNLLLGLVDPSAYLTF